MKRWLFIIVVITVSGWLPACKDKRQRETEYETMSVAYDESLPPTASSVTSSPYEYHSSSYGYSSPGYVDLSISHMVVQTARLSLKVSDVDSASNRAALLVHAKEGYIQQASSRQAQAASADLSIRVAPKNFIPLIISLAELGEVQSKEISGEDVTEEFLDLEAELETYSQLRTRLFRFLDRVKTVEEMLSVESELGRVDCEVNRIKGRMKYLKSMVAESEINLSLCEEAPAPPPPPPEPFFDWSKVGKTFKGIGRILLGILMFIVYALVFLIPLAIIAGAIAWLVLRVKRSLKERTKKSKDE